MRKNFKLTLGALCIAGTMMVSPFSLFAEASASNQSNTETVQGFAYHKIDFEEVSAEKVPTELMDKIEKNKAQSGFLSLVDDKNGVIYIAVLAGEKKSGGYDIKVTMVEDIEGRTQVTVQEKSPGKDDMVTQALTYPYTVIKAGGITPNITVKSDTSIEYRDLSKEEAQKPPVIVGVDKMTGILKSVKYVGKKVFITIKNQEGELVSYYASKGGAADKSLKKFKIGQKVIVKYVLGTPVKDAFPFSFVTEVPKTTKKVPAK